MHELYGGGSMVIIAIVAFIFCVLLAVGGYFMMSSSNKSSSSTSTTTDTNNTGTTTGVSNTNTQATAATAATTVTTQNPLNTESSLSNYYTFEADTFNNNKIKNMATSNSDMTLFNNPSISNSVFKIGKSSIYFNGNQQYATIDSGAINFTTNGLTFTSWYNFTSGGWTRLFDFANGTASDNILWSPGNGLSVYQGGSAITEPGGATGGRNDGKWHHFAWTLTYAAEGQRTSTWNMYIDGSVVYQNTSAGYPRILSRSKNYIGFSHWSSDGYSVGYVDDFRIYNRVLSSDEINRIYNLVN